MITFLNFLQKSIVWWNQATVWLSTMLDKIDMKYILVLAVIVLFWKMLDLFLCSEEL